MFEEERRNEVKKWKVMARPIDSIGFGDRVGIFVGSLNEWQRTGIDSLFARGYETVFPPLIPIGTASRADARGIIWDDIKKETTS